MLKSLRHARAVVPLLAACFHPVAEECPVVRTQPIQQADPCDDPAFLDRVEEIRVSMMEATPESGCWEWKDTTQDVRAFCRYAAFPFSAETCPEIEVMYFHEESGRCAWFPVHCNAGPHAGPEGWTASGGDCTSYFMCASDTFLGMEDSGQ